MSAVLEAPMETLDLHSVAKRLNVCERTVKRWADNGTMPPPVRIGGRLLRWNAAELNAWQSRLSTRRIQRGRGNE